MQEKKAHRHALATLFLSLSGTLLRHPRNLLAADGSQRKLRLPVRCTSIEMMRFSKTGEGTGVANSGKPKAEPKVDPELLSEPGSGKLSESDPRLIYHKVERGEFGVQWSADLNLRWPGIGSMRSTGSFAQSTPFKKGDLLVQVNNISMVGLEIKDMLSTFGNLKEFPADFYMFRGSREELKAVFSVSPPPETVTITVKQEGKPDESVDVPYLSNLRDALVERKYDVYKAISKVSNCGGNKLCGTCILDVVEGGKDCSMQTLNEAAKLEAQAFPRSYRLACQTEVYGSVTVELKPKLV